MGESGVKKFRARLHTPEVGRPSFDHISLPKIMFVAREMVELRSPDLWGVQSDAEFHARFANEGPEAVWAQFRG